MPKLRRAFLVPLIRSEAGPETTTDQEVPCRGCGAPLAARDDEFVLKYFLLRTATSQKAVAKATS